MINIARTNVGDSPIVSGAPIAATVEAMHVNRSTNFAVMPQASPEKSAMKHSSSGTTGLNSARTGEEGTHRKKRVFVEKQQQID